MLKAVEIFYYITSTIHYILLRFVVASKVKIMSVSQSREGSTPRFKRMRGRGTRIGILEVLETLECEPASTKKDQQCFFILSLTSFVLPEFHDLETLPSAARQPVILEAYEKAC